MEKMFSLAKERYPNYFPPRIWSSKNIVKSGKDKKMIKNIDNAIYAKLKKMLADNYEEIKGIFSVHKYPIGLLNEIKNYINTVSKGRKESEIGRAAGPVSLIKVMADYLPTCFILHWVVEKKLKEIENGEVPKLKSIEFQKSIYKEYYDYLNKVITENEISL